VGRRDLFRDEGRSVPIRPISFPRRPPEHPASPSTDSDNPKRRSTKDETTGVEPTEDESTDAARAEDETVGIVAPGPNGYQDDLFLDLCFMERLMIDVVVVSASVMSGRL
jgi:hypothetical protein